MNDQIPVSDYPDWLRGEVEKGEVEKTDKICPNCKVGKLERWFEADGPDDYRTVYWCPKCKERFDE